jgi:hypothetical protein
MEKFTPVPFCPTLPNLVEKKAERVFVCSDDETMLHVYENVLPFMPGFVRYRYVLVVVRPDSTPVLFITLENSELARNQLCVFGSDGSHQNQGECDPTGFVPRAVVLARFMSNITGQVSEVHPRVVRRAAKEYDRAAKSTNITRGGGGMRFLVRAVMYLIIAALVGAAGFGLGWLWDHRDDAATMPWADLTHWGLAVAFPAAVTWTVSAFVDTVEPMRTSGMFIGSWRRAFLAALGTMIAVFAISGLWWMFKVFPWWVPPLLIVIFCPVGKALYEGLQSLFLRGVRALILGNVILWGLHWIAWSPLRPV